MSGMSGEARREEAQLGLARYREAQANVMVSAAVNEHVLHDAVAEIFGKQRDQINLLLKDFSARQLSTLVRRFYSDKPGIAEACSTLDRLMEKRNRVVHGMVVELYDFEEGKDQQFFLNRKNPGIQEDPPTHSELEQLARELVEAAGVHLSRLVAEYWFSQWPMHPEDGHDGT